MSRRDQINNNVAWIIEWFHKMRDGLVANLLWKKTTVVNLSAFSEKLNILHLTKQFIYIYL